MFINRLKAKAVSGAHVVKNNIRRVVSRAPKMKFFYGSYYKKYDVIENRILFESFHGSTISDSPFYILKELLSRDDANILLASAGYSLSRSDDYDLAIAFCISRGIFDFNDINELLYELGFEVF